MRSGSTTPSCRPPRPLASSFILHCAALPYDAIPLSRPCPLKSVTGSYAFAVLNPYNVPIELHSASPPAITAVSKQLHQENMAIFFWENTFQVRVYSGCRVARVVGDSGPPRAFAHTFVEERKKERKRRGVDLPPPGRRLSITSANSSTGTTCGLFVLMARCQCNCWFPKRQGRTWLLDAMLISNPCWWPRPQHPEWRRMVWAMDWWGFSRR
jgi:hypothetical protein